MWIKTPFIFSALPSTMSTKEYETFTEMASDSSLQNKFKLMSLTEFWCSIKYEYHQLSQKAVLVIWAFVTTYMCETGLQVYLSTKTKCQTWCQTWYKNSTMFVIIKGNITHPIKIKIPVNVNLSCYKNFCVNFELILMKINIFWNICHFRCI